MMICSGLLLTFLAGTDAMSPEHSSPNPESPPLDFLVARGEPVQWGRRIDMRRNASENAPACFRLRVACDGSPKEPPREPGFGPRVIGQGKVHEPDGRAELKFAREGLECTIRVPVGVITGER